MTPPSSRSSVRIRDAGTSPSTTCRANRPAGTDRVVAPVQPGSRPCRPRSVASPAALESSSVGVNGSSTTGEVAKPCRYPPRRLPASHPSRPSGRRRLSMSVDSKAEAFGCTVLASLGRSDPRPCRGPRLGRRQVNVRVPLSPADARHRSGRPAAVGGSGSFILASWPQSIRHARRRLVTRVCRLIREIRQMAVIYRRRRGPISSASASDVGVGKPVWQYRRHFGRVSYCRWHRNRRGDGAQAPPSGVHACLGRWPSQPAPPACSSRGPRVHRLHRGAAATAYFHRSTVSGHRVGTGAPPPPPPPHAASPSVNTAAKHSVIKFFCVDIFKALLFCQKQPRDEALLHLHIASNVVQRQPYIH